LRRAYDYWQNQPGCYLLSPRQCQDATHASKTKQRVTAHDSRLFGFTCTTGSAQKPTQSNTQFQCLLEQTQATAPRSILDHSGRATKASLRATNNPDTQSVPTSANASATPPSKHSQGKVPGFYCYAMRDNKPTSPCSRATCENNSHLQYEHLLLQTWRQHSLH